MHHCELYGPFRETVGEKSLEREVNDDATIGEVFGDLADNYPDLRDFLFNHLSRGGGGETEIENGDVLSVSPPEEGG